MVDLLNRNSGIDKLAIGLNSFFGLGDISTDGELFFKGEFSKLSLSSSSWTLTAIPLKSNHLLLYLCGICYLNVQLHLSFFSFLVKGACPECSREEQWTAEAKKPALKLLRCRVHPWQATGPRHKEDPRWWWPSQLRLASLHRVI